ncbi:hypothetical protein OAG94_02445, partial [bacterium]|nr:hypothetical protein [bacterium]
MNCPECGEEVKYAFCGECGAPAPSEPADSSTKGLETAEHPPEATGSPGYLFWEVEEGEIARKLNESQLTEYGSGLKGFIVGPHQRALIYTGGKLVTELQSGSYDFPSKPKLEDLNRRHGGVLGALGGVTQVVSNFFLGEAQGAALERANADRISSNTELFIEHIKNGKPFSVVIVRSSFFQMGIALENIQVGEVKSDVALNIKCKITDVENFYMQYFADGNIYTFSKLEEAVISKYQAAVQDVLRTKNPLEIESNPALRAEVLAALNAASPDCLSIGEIEQISIQNEDLDRLKNEKEKLHLAEQELEQLHKTNQFKNRLQDETNRQALADAKSDEDFQAKMQEINKDGLLREEDLQKFQQQISERAEDHDISRLHALDLLSTRNTFESEKAKDDLIALNRSREVDDKDHDIDLQKRGREFERDQQRADDLADLDQLTRLKDLNESQKEGEHARRLQELEQFKGMTPDQILLVRPDLDANMVKAFCDGSKASQSAEQETQRSRENVEMMKEFMEKQLDVTRDIAVGRESAKEKEMERLQKSSSQMGENLTKAVASTVDTFKGAAAEATVKGSTTPSEEGQLFHVTVG